MQLFVCHNAPMREGGTMSSYFLLSPRCKIDNVRNVKAMKSPETLPTGSDQAQCKNPAGYKHDFNWFLGLYQANEWYGSCSRPWNSLRESSEGWGKNISRNKSKTLLFERSFVCNKFRIVYNVIIINKSNQFFVHSLNDMTVSNFDTISKNVKIWLRMH